MNRQLSDLQANGMSSSSAVALFEKYRCSKAHCANHSKHCYRISVTHYPISNSDIVNWAAGLTNGTATLEQPPPVIWEALRDWRSHDVASRRKRGLRQEAYGNAVRTSSNSMYTPPIINLFVGEGSSQKRCRLSWHQRESSFESNSEDSTELSDWQHT